MDEVALSCARTALAEVAHECAVADARPAESGHLRGGGQQLVRSFVSSLHTEIGTFLRHFLEIRVENGEGVGPNRGW